MVSRNEAHFVNIPGNKIPHSKLNLSHYNLSSFNVGELVPLTEPIEVLTGDNFDFSISSMVRLSTLIAPIMDNLFMDIYEFYVPFRILWENFKRFMGENDSAPWRSNTTYSIPQITSPSGGWTEGTIADYLRIPTGVSNLEISALPFRAYAKIVNDWFRDENVQYPADLVLDDSTIVGSNGDNYITDLIKGGKPFIVARTHDVFSSALPAPQRGDSVMLSLGNNAPVYTNPTNPVNLSDDLPIGSKSLAATDLSDVSRVLYSTDIDPQKTIAFADLSSAEAVSVNDLRLAFQTQRLLELMARGGTRYYEILANEWGVSAPQGLIQRSELLGCHRFNLRVDSVVQTSETTNTSPQGNLTGYSCTTRKHHDFHKAFSEPGVIMVLGCVRYQHSYCQGIPKLFKRKDKYDFYHPAFAHLGEQAIKNYQIYAQGNSQDEEVFGYQEAWVEYRYIPNGVTGEMRTTSNNTLDYWHFADKFDSLPQLSSDFIKESKSNVDRALAVSSAVSNQLQCQFYFDIKAIRPMPLYSIPGLIDHL